MKYQVGTQLMGIHSNRHHVIFRIYHLEDYELRFRLSNLSRLVTEEELNRKFIIIKEMEK